MSTGYAQGDKFQTQKNHLSVVDLSSNLLKLLTVCMVPGAGLEPAQPEAEGF